MNDVLVNITPSEILSIILNFIPGFLTCIVFKYLVGLKYKEIDAFTILFSAVISYLLNIIYNQFEISNILQITLVFISSVLIGIVSYCGYRLLSKNNIIKFTENISVLDTSVLGLEKNPIIYINVFLDNDEIISGQLECVDDLNEGNFSIACFCYCEKENGIVVRKSEYASDNVKKIINAKHILNYEIWTESKDN